MAVVKLASTFFLVISQLIAANSAVSEPDVLPAGAQLDEKWGMGSLTGMAKGAARKTAIAAARYQLKGTDMCTKLVPALDQLKFGLVDQVVTKMRGSADCTSDLKGPKCEEVIASVVNTVVTKKLEDSIAEQDASSIAMPVLTPVITEFMAPKLAKSIQDKIPADVATKMNSAGPLKGAITNPVGESLKTLRCDLCERCGFQREFSTGPQVFAVAQQTPLALIIAGTTGGIMMVGFAVCTLRRARARANLRRVQGADPEELVE